MSSVKLGFEIKDEARHAKTEDIERAVKDLTVSLLFLVHLFGVSGVTVTITRGDCDEYAWQAPRARKPLHGLTGHEQAHPDVREARARERENQLRRPRYVV